MITGLIGVTEDSSDLLEVTELVEALLLGLRLYRRELSSRLYDSWGIFLTGVEVEETRLLLISSMARLMSF